jgi:hypothetical protein
MPDNHAEAVAPSDAADLPKGKTKALWVGGAGNLSVDMASGATVLISGVPAGTRLPFSVKRVRSTNTTATLILAVY